MNHSNFSAGKDKGHFLAFKKMCAVSPEVQCLNVCYLSCT